ncbi:YfjI family protein [Aquisphaera giovannonii]|nr:DUF3987 domain-containing protein [Aquisphaera giovannonii]
MPGDRVRMPGGKTGTVRSADGTFVSVRTDGAGGRGPRIRSCRADRLISLDEEEREEIAKLEDAEIVDRWPRIRPEAFRGIAGEVVELAGPHTEADPVAVLVQFLVAVANMIGRGPHFRVAGTEHHLNLFACLVGATGSARKGTSWDVVRFVLRPVDPSWADARVRNGLVSGEGLIHNVRDRRVERKEVVTGSGANRSRSVEAVMIDAGVDDKRLMIVEAEFARTLKAMAPRGNTLSDVLRLAWEGGTLSGMSKHAPETATAAHLSVLGHVTREDLQRHLADEDMANGFGNRFLWLCARRSKELPGGGNLEGVDWGPVREEIEAIRAFAANPTGTDDAPVLILRRDDPAEELWRRMYTELTADKPGLVGNLLSRAAAQVMRLACIYAVLDRSPVVSLPHLEAARAVWDYCEASARYIFGDAHGDPDAERLLAALGQAPEGLTRTEISRVFQGNRTSAWIGNLLGRLLSEGTIHRRGGADRRGRAQERWHAGRSSGPRA